MKIQIVTLQTLHYLTLAILVSPLLALFAESNSLEYEGGAVNVGMPHCSCFVRDILIALLSRYVNGLETDGRKTDHGNIPR